MNKKSTFRSVANNYLTHPLKEAGITLIALVVTIIVLLILAGITISLVLNNNGIIQRAKDASGIWENASANEEIMMGTLYNDISTHTEGYVNLPGEENTSKITGQIGQPVNTNNYGKIVTNYNAKNLEWRLFYEDSNYIYLLSEPQEDRFYVTEVGLYEFDENDWPIYNDETEHYNIMVDATSGEDVSQQGKDLMPLAGGAALSDVGTNPNGLNIFTSDNKGEAILQIAYLCDVADDGPWAEYVEGNAVWAMGSPTGELYAASYNATYDDDLTISFGETELDGIRCYVSR